jgi:hypothetical protein
MGKRSFAHPGAHRKGANDESYNTAYRSWLARAGMTLALTAGLALVALAPVAAPAVAGLAHIGHVAPVVAHARPLPNCPGAEIGC